MHLSYIVGFVCAISAYALDTAYPIRTSSPTAMAIRAANLSDMEEVVEVVLSAMPHDPQWDYRFPHRKEYPKEHLKYTKLLFECFLNQTWDDWQVMVVEAPSVEDRTVAKVVSISVWDVSFRNIRKHGQAYKPQDRLLPSIPRFAGWSAHVTEFVQRWGRC